MCHLVAEICLSGLLHLLKHHSADFLRRKHLRLTVHRHLDGRLTLLLNELEGEVLDVLLNISLTPLATNETLRVKDRVLGVLGGLVLGSVTNETLVILGEGHVRGCNTVTLVVGNDFDTALTLYTDTRVRGTQVNTDYRAVLTTLVLRSHSRSRVRGGRQQQREGQERNKSKQNAHERLPCLSQHLLGSVKGVRRFALRGPAAH